MKKSLLWIVVVLLSIAMVAAFSLYGCKAEEEAVEEEAAPAVEAPAEEEAVAAEPVTINYFTWRQEDDAVWQQVISEFEAANPNITVEISYSADNTAHYNTLTANLPTGEGLDVVDIHGNPNFLRYIDEDLLLDLTDEPFVANLTDGVKEITEYKDKFWGFPAVQNLIGCIYNKTLFEENGVEVPTDYADFVNIMATLKSAGLGGVAYLGKDVGIDWLFNCLYCEGFGAAAFKAFKESIDNGELTNMADNEGAYSVLKQFADMNEKGILYANSDTTGYPESLTLFAQQKAPVVMMGTWTFGTAENDYPGIDFGYFPFPSSASPGIGYGEIGQISCVAANSKNIEAAKLFVNFLAERNDIYTEGTKMMSTMKTVTNTFKGADVVKAQIAKGAVMLSIPIIPNQDLWGNSFADMGKNILFKGADVDSEIAKFETVLVNADLKSK